MRRHPNIHSLAIEPESVTEGRVHAHHSCLGAEALAGRSGHWAHRVASSLLGFVAELELEVVWKTNGATSIRLSKN